jgi:hypothetical protein
MGGSGSWSCFGRGICASAGAELGVGVVVDFGVGVWFILISERVRHAARKGFGQKAGRKGCGWIFGTANFKSSFGTHAERARRRERERAHASTNARKELARNRNGRAKDGLEAGV